MRLLHPDVSPRLLQQTATAELLKARDSNIIPSLTEFIAKYINMLMELGLRLLNKFVGPKPFWNAGKPLTLLALTKNDNQTLITLLSEHLHSLLLYLALQ
jgi:hypothetical protein